MSDWEIVGPAPSEAQDEGEWEIVGAAEAPQQKGWKGIAQEATKSGAEFARDLANFITSPEKRREFLRNAAPEIAGAARQISPFPSLPIEEFRQAKSGKEFMDLLGQYQPPQIRGAQNIISGLGQGILGAINTPAIAADYLAKKEAISPTWEGAVPRVPLKPEDLLFQSLREKQQPGDILLREAASMAPYAFGGEAGLAGRGLLRTAPQRAGAQALHAIGQEQDPVKAALAMATSELAARLPQLGYKAGQGIGKAYEKLTPSNVISKYFSGNLPLEEIMKNVKAAEGTETSLGRILQSPGLTKSYETFTADLPFAGGSKTLPKLSEDIRTKGMSTLDNLSDIQVRGDSNEIAHKILLDAKKGETKIKNEMFEPVNKLAEKEKFYLDLPESTAMAKESIKAIQDTPLYKNNTKFQKAINKLFQYTETSEAVPSMILGPTGKPLISKTNRTSIVEARTIADDLYDTGSEYLKSQNAIDKEQGTLFLDLAKSMKKEINQEITTKGSSELQKADSLAMENYKKNFAPFKDKDLYKLLTSGELSETFINDVIKPGKKLDKAKRITKVLNLIPEKDRPLLGQAYLSQAVESDGFLDPRKLASQWNSLGKRQKKALFSPEAKNNMEDFVRLVNLNPEAVNYMFIPKTGYRGGISESTRQALEYTKLVPAALLGISGALPGLGSAAATIGGARLFNHWMKSPKFREKVINKKIDIEKLKSEAQK